MNRYIIKNIIFLLITSLGVTLAVTMSSQHKIPVIAGRSSSSLSLYSASGRFFLNKSVSALHLFDYGGQYSIINKFNLTIAVEQNSTSSVQINRTGISKWYHPNYWEGPIEFSVNPGELSVQTYTSHYCSDTFDNYIVFFGLITSSNASASGFFNVTELNYGIYPQECGTGNLFVSNITEWLNNREMSTEFSSDSSTSPLISLIDSSEIISNSIPFFLFALFILSSVVIQRRTREKS